jgi:hypothetical protein
MGKDRREVTVAEPLSVSTRRQRPFDLLGAVEL